MEADLTIEDVLARERNAQAWLADVVGPDPARMAGLLAWPNRDVAEIGAGIEMAPLEAAVAGAVNALGGRDGIRQFFKDYGAIATARMLAIEFGIVCDPDVGNIERNRMAYECGRFLTCLRAAIVLASNQARRGLIVDIAIAHLDELIATLAGRDAALNDFLYTRRLALSRKTGEGQVEATQGGHGAGSADTDWQREREFMVPKWATISTGEKKVYPDVLQDIAGRIRALTDDPESQAAAARQVCEWMQVGQGRPNDRYRWYLPSATNIRAYGMEMVAAVRQRLDSGQPELHRNIRLRIDESFGHIKSVVDIIATSGVGTQAQIRRVQTMFNRPGRGRARDWLFDVKRLASIARTMNSRYRMLCLPENPDCDWPPYDGAVGGDPRKPDYYYDPDPLGDMGWWDDDVDDDSACDDDADLDGVNERREEGSDLADDVGMPLAARPCLRMISEVRSRHRNAYRSTDVPDHLAADLAWRFDLVSVEDGYSGRDWRDPGAASRLFRTNLSRAIRLTPDDEQRALVVDIAIDHVARVWDELFASDSLDYYDYLLFQAYMRTEMGYPCPAPDSSLTNYREGGGEPTLLYHMPNEILDRVLDPERSDSDPSPSCDVTGARRMVWFPPEGVRLERKAWVKEYFPDDDPGWWADLEDRLVENLLGLDDDPWVVQRAARHTISAIQTTPDEFWGDEVWLGFSPPEVLRQSMLSLRALLRRLSSTRDRGVSSLIMDVAPYLARIQELLERPGVMNSTQSTRLDNMFWIWLNGPAGLRQAETT